MAYEKDSPMFFRKIDDETILIFAGKKAGNLDGFHILNEVAAAVREFVNGKHTHEKIKTVTSLKSSVLSLENTGKSEEPLARREELQ